MIRLATETGLPVVSGGDRHCLEANANVNLTNATTFAEFASEIRRERLSRVLFLPQYCEPITKRYIEFIWQAVRTYPDLLGREQWLNRMFYEADDGTVKPMAATWSTGAPAAVRGFINCIRFLAGRAGRHLRAPWRTRRG